LSAVAVAADSMKINDIVIAGPLQAAEARGNLKAVLAFYEFWTGGDAAC